MSRKDSHHIEVHITFRDDKCEIYQCTDFPSIGSDWVICYDGLRRDCIPTQAVKKVIYDVKKSPTK